MTEKNSAGRRIAFWARVALTAGLASYLVGRTDWKAFSLALGNLHVGGCLLALAIYLGSQTVSAVRWAGLAEPLGFVFPIRRFVRFYFEGMFFSLCLPTSIGGDVVKACRLSDHLRGRVLAGCTVLADRLAGLAALLAIALAAVARQSFGLSVAGTLLANLGLLLGTWLGICLGIRLLRRLAVWLPLNRLKRLNDRLGPYQDQPQLVAKAVGWSLIVQATSILTVACLAWSLGMQVPLTVFCMGVPLVAMATVMPLSIAGVGVREGGLAWFLSTYGVAPEAGVALGLLWSLVSLVGGLIGGVVYLYGARRVETQSQGPGAFADGVFFPTPGLMKQSAAVEV